MQVCVRFMCVYMSACAEPVSDFIGTRCFGYEEDRSSQSVSCMLLSLAAHVYTSVSRHVQDIFASVFALCSCVAAQLVLIVASVVLTSR